MPKISQFQILKKAVNEWMVSSARTRVWAVFTYGLLSTIACFLYGDLINNCQRRRNIRALWVQNTNKNPTYTTPILTGQQVIHEMNRLTKANHRIAFARLFWKQMQKQISHWLKSSEKSKYKNPFHDSMTVLGSDSWTTGIKYHIGCLLRIQSLWLELIPISDSLE